MLRIHNLCKRFDDHLVFEGLSYDFPQGCFALCDEENNGKSTLLAIVAGVIAADAGEVWIDGYSITDSAEEAKSRLAYVPDDCMAEPRLTGRELLQRVAEEKDVLIDEQTLAFAADLGLEPHIDKRFEQMSTGNRRKAYLVAANLGHPSVIIADGPSNGLDAPARAALADQFIEWSRERVVLFASHDEDLIDACGAIRLSLSDLHA